MPEDSAYLNHVWSRTIVETLLTKGLRHAVICPGSRSSSLALAFARTAGIESVPVLDERSAGFFALGMAKRDGRPVAVVCTSGTAAVNLYPAVVEAKECGVPLILLTADRPHELRDCRSRSDYRSGEALRFLSSSSVGVVYPLGRGRKLTLCVLIDDYAVGAFDGSTNGARPCEFAF